MKTQLVMRSVAVAYDSEEHSDIIVGVDTQGAVWTYNGAGWEALIMEPASDSAFEDDEDDGDDGSTTEPS